MVVVPKHELQVPKTIKQADASQFRDEWREARLEELQRLEEMSTWDLVPSPS